MHTAELASAVCIILQSQTPLCASHRQVSKLPSIYFVPKFYKFYFSVMHKDINMKIIT